jgi:hypothetical protein
MSLPYFIPVPSRLTNSHHFFRHGISSPREPEDLFFLVRTHPREIFEASYPIEPPRKLSKWRRQFDLNRTVFCLECASGKPWDRCRRFILDDVKRHLLARYAVHSLVWHCGRLINAFVFYICSHKVTSPIAGTHYG